MVTSTSRFFDTGRGVVPALLLLSGGAFAAGEPDWFEDVAAEAGVEFTYANGMDGEYYFPEIMGGGAALLDYDNDGLLDLYLVQAGAIGPEVRPGDRSRSDRLYRNDSYRDNDGEWVIRFTDVTAAAGIDARGYGMGVAVGDYTGNQYPDIYVLNFGDNQLWRNNGDGTFTDATDAAGVNDSRWSVSGSFADIDGDGRLDLTVVNYSDFTFENHKQCHGSGSGSQDYCSPSAYDPAADSLFRNLGDGRFRDITDASGIGAEKGHGLGVISADLDNDGMTDIYVANDGDPNFFWVNQGEMRFDNDAMLSGNAVNVDGAAEAGMGVALGDHDRSGALDLFITHLGRESNTLYRNDGKGWFTDTTSASGLGAPSLPYTGFGTEWLDIDLDGWLDLIVVNGAVTEEEALVAMDDPFPYHQTNQVFVNRGDGRFSEQTRQAGAWAARSRVSRGAAFGDIDNDGRVDAVVVNINQPAEILMNRLDRGHHWLGLKPVSNGASAVGAQVWLLEDGKPGPVCRSGTDGSYASANDPRIVFGLGSDDGLQTIRVRWPDGTTRAVTGLSPGQYHAVHKDGGE